VFLEIRATYPDSKFKTEPTTEWVGMRRYGSRPLNPTGWRIFYSGYPQDGSTPANQCG